MNQDTVRVLTPQLQKASLKNFLTAEWKCSCPLASFLIGFLERLIMQNAVFAIRPYRWHNMWVFDDERVGLVKEPFVMGIPEIINKAVAHLPNPEAGFTVLFNNTGLPSPDVVLNKLNIDSGGTWYQQEGTGMKGWLCPALFKYYPEAPEKLYIKVSE